MRSSGRSFLVVARFMFATPKNIFSISRDLQDKHAVGPLRIQKFRKNSIKLGHFIECLVFGLTMLLVVKLIVSPQLSMKLCRIYFKNSTIKEISGIATENSNVRVFIIYNTTTSRPAPENTPFLLRAKNWFFGTSQKYMNSQLILTVLIFTKIHFEKSIFTFATRLR